MNTIFFRVSFLIIIISAICISSCKKTTIRKLEGTWTVEVFGDTTFTETWTFASANEVYVEKIYSKIDSSAFNMGIPTSVSVSGTYTLESAKKMKIEGFEQEIGHFKKYADVHSWKIDKLTNSVLILLGTLSNPDYDPDTDKEKDATTSGLYIVEMYKE